MSADRGHRSKHDTFLPSERAQRAARLERAERRAEREARRERVVCGICGGPHDLDDCPRGDEL